MKTTTPLDYQELRLISHRQATLQILKACNSNIKQEPNLDVRIKYIPPLILDNISIGLGSWSDTMCWLRTKLQPAALFLEL
ncbi:hypothetical protein GYA19_01555 [Candidatus Beckwithbacteria bacterium]|nr:hypothetical protein [Candidatus Beckwithbacteria bacterium]